LWGKVLALAPLPTSPPATTHTLTPHTPGPCRLGLLKQALARAQQDLEAAQRSGGGGDAGRPGTPAAGGGTEPGGVGPPAGQWSQVQALNARVLALQQAVSGDQLCGVGGVGVWGGGDAACCFSLTRFGWPSVLLADCSRQPPQN
jgi:hypothetical protein